MLSMLFVLMGVIAMFMMLMFQMLVGPMIMSFMIKLVSMIMRIMRMSMRV